MAEIFHPRVRLVSLVGCVSKFIQHFTLKMCFFILSPFHLHFIQFHVYTSVDSLNYHAKRTLPNLGKVTKTGLRNGHGKVWLLGSSDSNQLHHQHCKAILSVFSKSIRSEFPHVRVPG